MLYLRCPNPKCTRDMRVPPELYAQFHVLRCPICQTYIDRRLSKTEAISSPATFTAPSTEPSAEDLKLLRELRIGWEAPHE